MSRRFPACKTGRKLMFGGTPDPWLTVRKLRSLEEVELVMDISDLTGKASDRVIESLVKHG